MGSNIYLSVEPNLTTNIIYLIIIIFIIQPLNNLWWGIILKILKIEKQDTRIHIKREGKINYKF